MSSEERYLDEADDYANDPIETAPDETGQADARAAETPAFDQLELALSVRCGALRLSLAQLRQLGPGSTVEVEGIAPGYATLCHGEVVVAEGELVDVDGRLGLQITRLAARP